MDIDEIVRLLRKQHGQPERRPCLDPLSELIATILSQNTSDLNSGRAFEWLIATFRTWELVADAHVDEIVAAIAGGGLSRVKAPRIKAILGRIREERDSFDLSFLGGMPLEEARVWLESLPGVGPKTAACVLLFSLGRPALPVDTHVYRIARRLGLLGDRVSVEVAHRVLQAMVPAESIYEFHMNMVKHGRKVCRSRRPLCSGCGLIEDCTYGKTAVREAGG
ncbi:MAG: endonuclease III [Chloroflexota bacterium]|nr:endonuclease III [Chloroflexota bacterium]